MKHTKTKILSFVLAMLMIVGMMPMGMLSAGASEVNAIGDVFAQVICEVYYYANDGVNTHPLDHYFISSQATPSSTHSISDMVPTRDGYTFLGWAKSPAATVPEYPVGSSATILVGGTVNLYAVWAKQASADEWDGSIATGFGGGSGSEADPYLIYTAEELAYLAQSVNAGTTYSGKYFKLMNDIDLKGLEWTPIGKSTLNNQSSPNPLYFSYTFRGNFAGSGHKIFNMAILHNNTSFTGLFGTVVDGSVSHLGIENATIKAVVGSGYRSKVGALAGTICNATISNCYVINADISNDAISKPSSTAALIGLASYGKGSSISNCYVTGSVQGDGHVSMILGGIYSTAVYIENCYATGTATISGENSNTAISIGSIVGYISRVAYISDCFFDGTISNTASISSGTISGDSASIDNCYYNCVSSVYSYQGTSTSASNFASQSWIESNLGWDFTTVWEMKPGADYPTLRGFGESGAVTPPAHTHSYTTVETPATCTTSGVKKDVCSCGDEINVVYLPAPGHAYVSEVTKEATCLEDGIITYTCSACGHSYTVVVHVEHSYVQTVIEPTCTVDGATVYTCSKCGDTQRIPIPASHSYTSEVTKPATRYEDGIITYTCSKCGHSYTETIPASNANVLLIQDSIPWDVNNIPKLLTKMTQDGYISGWSQTSTTRIGSVDLSSYDVILIANDQTTATYNQLRALNDALTDFVIGGGTLIYGACDHGWSAGDISYDIFDGIKKTDFYSMHNYIVDTMHPIVTGALTDDKALTNELLQGTYCSHSGFLASSLPAGYNIILQDGQGNATLVEYPQGAGRVILSGLTWEFYYSRIYAGTSSYSMNVFDDLIAYAVNPESGCAHTFDAGVVVEPTCTTDGYTLHTCTTCGGHYKDTYIPALGHLMGSWIIDRDPTCEESGSKHQTCTRCGETVRPVIPPKGHVASGWIISKPATAIDSGLRHKECTVCGKVLATEVIPPFSPIGLTTNGYYSGGVWQEGGPNTITDPKTGITYSQYATAVGFNQYDVTYTVTTSTVETQNKTSVGAATVLIVDLSGSMVLHQIDNITILQAAKNAAMQFLANYAGTNKNDARYISLVTFNDNATVALDWVNVAGGPGCNDYDKALASIKALNTVSGPGTYVNYGMDKASSQLSSAKISSISSKNALLFTDGVFSCSNSQALYAANTLKAKSTVYTVFGRLYNTSEYLAYGTWLQNNVASSPDKAFTVNNVAQLNTAFGEVTGSIISGLTGDGFVITDTLSQYVTTSGSKSINIVLNKADAAVTTSGRLESGLTTTYTYTYTVRVSLDTENIPGFEETKFYPVSAADGASLDLANGIDTDLIFPVPGIRLRATASTYHVTYNANGGSGSVPTDAQAYNPGDTVTVKFTNLPVMSGYVFLGWGENAAQTVPTYTAQSLQTFNIGSTDVTLYAIWEKIADTTYTVTYDANGGSGSVPVDSNSYRYNDTVSVKFNTIPTYAGHKFLGWAGTPDASAATYTAGGDTSFRIGKDNVVLYAVWAEVDTHTVTFVNYDGQVLYTTEVTNGSPVIYAGVTPAKPDDADAYYTFAGWDRSLTHITEDVTIGALFTRVPYTSIVKLEHVQLGKVAYGTTVGKLGLPGQIKATTASGGTIQLTVTWDTSTYNPYRAGSQNIFGKVTIPARYVSTVGTQVTASVTVESAPVQEIIEITDITSPAGISVEYGTAAGKLALPETVVATTAKGTIKLTVNWSSIGYVSTQYGEQVLTGTVKVPYGYALADGVSKNVQITVTVSKVIITEIADIDMGLVPERCTYENIGLPKTVAVSTAGGAIYYLPVTWTRSDYNPNVLGRQTIRGTVTIEEGFILGSGVDNAIIATVTTSDSVIGQADIVFLVDTTGSMYDEIQNVKNNIRNFAEYLNNRGIVLRWALIEYRDITCDGANSTQIHLCGYDNWYIDVNRFKDEIARLTVSGGGDREETIIDALEAAHTLDARTGVSRFYIAVTDADFKNANNYGVSSMAEEIKTLVSKGINTSVVTKTSFYDTYRPLTDGTGGILANIDGNFANELLKIAEWVYDGVIDLKLTEIRVTVAPNKTRYQSGERFDGAGMVITAYYEDGSSRTVTGYSVSPIRPLAVGDTSVEINYRGRTTTVAIEVSKATIPVTSVKLDQDTLTMNPGYSHALNVTVLPVSATNKQVTWSSSNINVVEVDENGVLYARGIGTAVITVTTNDGGRTDTIAVTVIAPTVPVTGIELNQEGVSMEIHDKLNLIVSFTPENATDKSVTWTSSNTSVVQVDANGQLTAVGAGEAVITVTSRDGGYTAYCRVTVLPAVIPDEPQMVIGSASGKAGDTVTIDLTLSNVPDLKVLALYDFEYDRTQLELIGGEWKVNGVIRDWNSVTQRAILTYASNTDSNTVIFSLTFRILDEATSGKYDVSCTLSAKENVPGHGDVSVDVRVVAGQISVKGASPADLDGDNAVTSDDAIYLLWSMIDPTMYPVHTDCDFNKDGYVDSDDAIYLMYHIYFPDEYPVD